MITEEIAEHPTTKSLRFKARMIGLFYLLYFLTAIAAGLLVKGIVVPGNAAATAANILTRESFMRSGSAVSLISTALYIVMAALFYDLLKPVNKTLSLLAAFFALVGCAIQAVGSIFQLSPLLILAGSPYLHVFTIEQVHALALLFLQLQRQASSIEIIFFGFYDVLIGYLLLKSLFLPRFLGVLMGMAGFGWLTFLAPPVSGHLSPFVEIVGFLAELALMLWLLAKGVDPERWKEKARAASAFEA